MKKKKPVLQDIADRIGISKMTVSRYLCDPRRVSERLQVKIATALNEFGYIPNRAPGILSNSTSRAIGVLLPSLTNQVFSEVLRGIESITDKHHYQTMLAHYGYQPKLEEERLTSLLSYSIDGLILSERTHTERTLKMIKVAGIPVVEVMDSVSPCIDMAVGFDNFKAAYQMTKRMITRGYCNTVYLGARQDERTLIKQQGYERAMCDNHLQPKSVLVASPSSYSIGCQLLDKTLKVHPKTNGIFCTNDDLAIGAMFECQRRGLAIPKDMAIAGFHGHDIGQVMKPRLASVLTPRECIGRMAAKCLLERLHNKMSSSKQIDVGFSVIDGESI